MSDTLKIIITEDGSHSLFHCDLNETYHSFHGALQESRHVFIEHGLNYWIGKNQKNQINILEIGFGTGLNALLTCLELSKKENKVIYTTLEPFPLDDEILNKLNYPTEIKQSNAEGLFQKIHASLWENQIEINAHFSLVKKKIKLEKFEPDNSYDIIYFDAFAPSKQAEMWSLDQMRKISNLMKKNAVFVTYCAKGQLKRDLASLGLIVEALAGPPGKKEMVRGLKPL